MSMCAITLSVSLAGSNLEFVGFPSRGPSTSAIVKQKCPDQLEKPLFFKLESVEHNADPCSCEPLIESQEIPQTSLATAGRLSSTGWYSVC